MMATGKNPSSTLLSFPFPSSPALSFSFSSASLQLQEDSVEERDWVMYQNTLGKKIPEKGIKFSASLSVPKT